MSITTIKISHSQAMETINAIMCSCGQDTSEGFYYTARSKVDTARTLLPAVTGRNHQIYVDLIADYERRLYQVEKAA